MHTLICGSIAYDTIMVFQDRFRNHILPEQIHILNVSFLVPDMRREFGGCAGNIAYNLRMLGGNPLIMATVGEDYQPYSYRLDRLKLSQAHVRPVKDTFTAQAFITTDLDDNQITAFHPGAMNYSHLNHVGDATEVTLGIVAPDGRVLAAAQSAQLSLARLTMLAEPAYTGLHPFLGDGTPAASGVMIVEYSAASALAELRALATPAGIQAVTLSRGVEEDASFATLAARQALDAVPRFRAVLAAELVAALRGLRMQGQRPAVLEPALAWLDARDGGVPDMHDRDLTRDLVESEESVTALADLVVPVRRDPAA